MENTIATKSNRKALLTAFGGKPIPESRNSLCRTGGKTSFAITVYCYNDIYNYSLEYQQPPCSAHTLMNLPQYSCTLGSV